MTKDEHLMQDTLDLIEQAIKSGDWKVDGACDPDFILFSLRNRLKICSNKNNELEQVL